jgi:leucyl-tRNA synthetase
VDANGFSWRSGAKVEKLLLKQWFLRIKAFQNSLLEDMKLLEADGRWPERVLTMQRNWLGKSEGVQLRFGVFQKRDKQPLAFVDVFTTRLDTIYGVQYLALSLNHPLVVEAAKRFPTLRKFVDRARDMPHTSKEGFIIPDIYAMNPVWKIKGLMRKRLPKQLPVYVAPYVLEEYGSGAVMGVPAHDTRDQAFWRQKRGTERVLTVVNPPTHADIADVDPDGQPELFTGKGVLNMVSGPFAGFDSDEAEPLILESLNQRRPGTAKRISHWRLRDWLVSRQRYWGTPIPIIHCSSCGAVPVPEADLPVVLPELPNGQIGKGGNPLEHISAWTDVPCPKCNQQARRETDTMDTFMDSSWYYFRFLDTENSTELVKPETANEYMPVDVYIGGVEHAILHLLYARFISKFLTKAGIWPAQGGIDNKGEPFRQLITQGMVHGKTYSDPVTGRFLRPSELDLSNPNQPKIKATGKTPNISFEKMSKSKYNGVDPGECIANHGADVTRAHMLFAAPVSDVLEWHEDRIVGITRWFTRLWKAIPSGSRALHEPGTESEMGFDAASLNGPDADLWLLTQNTIVSVTHSLEQTCSLNTVISDLIKLTNTLVSTIEHKEASQINPNVRYHTTSALIRMLAPIGPAFAEECWEHLHTHPSEDGADRSIFDYPFPVVDQAAIKVLSSQNQTCVAQINGKFKFATKIPLPDAALLAPERSEELRAWVVDEILSTEEGQKLFGPGGKVDIDSDVQKVVVVKGGKTVNFVV